MSKPQAALFDVDGTLLDSNDAHASSWVETLAEFGIRRAVEDVKPLIGMRPEELVSRLAHAPVKSVQGRLITQRRTQIFLEGHVGTTRPFPAVRSLLERMRGDGILLALATSAGAEVIPALLNAAKVSDLFTVPDLAPQSRPAPDVVEAALERSGLLPRHAILLGGTPYDVAAAARAKVRVVAFRCGGWNDYDLHGATKIYDDPAGLLAHYSSSPFGNEML